MKEDANSAVSMLVKTADKKNRNLQMPGDGRYQPKSLKAFLGYDQWAGWLIIVEWFWMKVLAVIWAMPRKDAVLLTEERLYKLFLAITTTKQDAKEAEKGIKHDILALLVLMRKHLPKKLHRWLHFCATSYDIINTAYALQLKMVFELEFMPKLRQLDELWRNMISENASVIQAGRTHLQTALPVTIGFWLANTHNRFVSSARKANELSREIPGKFSGAVGTSASQRVLIESIEGEKILMDTLGLPAAEVSTQITPPEGMARFYHELVLLSGALANLGEDVRILQCSQFGEILSESSSSSAMSHKRANPIAAENLAGMHVTVIAEYMKVLLTLVSDLQRDLRWSNVLRSFSAIAVYVFQQILTAERLLKSIKVDKDRCHQNFDRDCNLVVAELLHLSLQREGLQEAHNFVNKNIIPVAAHSGKNLLEVMEEYTNQNPGLPATKIWDKLNPNINQFLINPKLYIGDAIKIAKRETENKL